MCLGGKEVKKAASIIILQKLVTKIHHCRVNENYLIGLQTWRARVQAGQRPDGGSIEASVLRDAVQRGVRTDSNDVRLFVLAAAAVPVRRRDAGHQHGHRAAASALHGHPAAGRERHHGGVRPVGHEQGAAQLVQLRHGAAVGGVPRCLVGAHLRAGRTRLHSRQLLQHGHAHLLQSAIHARHLRRQPVAAAAGSAAGAVDRDGACHRLRAHQFLRESLLPR